MAIAKVELIIYLVLGLAGFWLIQHFIGKKISGKALGQSSAPIALLFPEIDKQASSLVFFHAPGCSPCNAMLPDIQALAQETGRAFKVDIAENHAIAQAMGIRVTPTTLLIKDGLVAKSLIGSKNRKVLATLLEE